MDKNKWKIINKNGKNRIIVTLASPPASKYVIKHRLTICRRDGGVTFFIFARNSFDFLLITDKNNDIIF